MNAGRVQDAPLAVRQRQDRDGKRRLCHPPIMKINGRAIGYSQDCSLFGIAFAVYYSATVGEVHVWARTWWRLCADGGGVQAPFYYGVSSVKVQLEVIPGGFKIARVV